MVEKIKAQLKDWDYSPIVLSVSPWYNSVNKLFREKETGGSKMNSSYLSYVLN